MNGPPPSIENEENHQDNNNNTSNISSNNFRKDYSSARGASGSQSNPDYDENQPQYNNNNLSVTPTLQRSQNQNDEGEDDYASSPDLHERHPIVPSSSSINSGTKNTIPVTNQKDDGEENQQKQNEQHHHQDIFITMNNPQENLQYNYPDNFIKTYKYEWWAFIFVNLFYQFLKVSNFFFLLNAVYSLIPDVSPFSPIVSIAPLLFVVGVAMIKDGVEDIYRHIADAEANSIVAHVVRRLTVEEREKVLEKERKEEEEKKLKHQQQQNSSSPAPPQQQQQHQQPYYKTLNLETKVMEKGPKGEDVEVYYRLVDVQSRDVQVGDIMMIKNGEEIRADVLLLSSTGSEGSSFIETCNLDGETNLKNRKAVPETWFIKDVESAVRVTKSLKIKTTEPSPHLLHWGGVMTIEKNDEDQNENNTNQEQQQEISLGLEQFLYRSSVLKNTELAWGVVLYAGVDTKMFRNLEDRPPKRSNLDVKLN